MADDFRHASPGERLVIPAQAWNGAMDAARAHRERSGQNARFDPTRVGLNPCHTARARNESGEDLPQHSVVVLRYPIITPTDNETEFKAQPLLRAYKPVKASRREKIGITQEPIADGAIGVVAVYGVTPVKIFAHTASPNVPLIHPHRFADVRDGVLSSLAYAVEEGPAEILWRDGGYGSGSTGEKWALVNLTNVIRRRPITAKLTSIGGRVSDTYIGSNVANNKAYSWEQRDPGGQGALSGTAGAFVTFALYSNPRTWKLTIGGTPTSGTFKITGTPGSTTALAYNASAGTISSALTTLYGTTVTATGDLASGLFIPFPASETGTPSITDVLLYPLPGGAGPAVQTFYSGDWDLLNYNASSPDLRDEVVLSPGRDWGSPWVECIKLVTGDEDSIKTKYALIGRNIAGGKYTLKYDGDETADIEWGTDGAKDALAAEGASLTIPSGNQFSYYETTPLILEFTDFDDHDIEFGSDTKLFNGNFWYTDKAPHLQGYAHTGSEYYLYQTDTAYWHKRVYRNRLFVTFDNTIKFPTQSWPSTPPGGIAGPGYIYNGDIRQSGAFQLTVDGAVPFVSDAEWIDDINPLPAIGLGAPSGHDHIEGDHYLPLGVKDDDTYGDNLEWMAFPTPGTGDNGKALGYAVTVEGGIVTAWTLAIISAVSSSTFTTAVGSIEGRLDSIESRLDAVEATLADHEARITALE